MSSPAALLAGIRVIDLTHALAGPLCTQRLGDMGAEIIKVEAPNRPDFTRKSPLRGVWRGGETLSFLSLNRNKKSVAIDLKAAAGQDVFKKLVATSDVVIQNMRPAAAKRLGLTFEQLREVNSRIVYVSISGYGAEGPLADSPGQDLLVQSFSGMTMNAGVTGSLPHPAPVYLIDVAASHSACEAILAGLLHRDRTSQPVHAEVSLLASALEIQIQEITTYMTAGPLGERGRAPFASTWQEPPYGIYQLRDGYLALAQGDLKVLAEVLEIPELKALAEGRPKDDDLVSMRPWRDRVYEVISDRLAVLDRDATVTKLRAHAVWCGPVFDYSEMISQEQTSPLFVDVEHPSAGTIKTLAPTIRFAGADEQTPIAPAPHVGQHSRQVLTSLGLDPAHIDQLIREAVVYQNEVEPFA